MADSSDDADHPGAPDLAATIGPRLLKAVLDGGGLMRFTIASAERITIVDTRIAFKPGSICEFPTAITELR